MSDREQEDPNNEARAAPPLAEQPQAPTPRRIVLPVRFQDPIASTIDNRPVLYEPRATYQEPPLSLHDPTSRERRQHLPPARYQSYYEDVDEQVPSFLGEIERERASPAPFIIRESYRREDSDQDRIVIDENPEHMPRRVRIGSDDSEVRQNRLRRDRQSSSENRRPRDRVVIPPDGPEDYQPRRRSPSRQRSRRSYYDDEDDFHVPTQRNRPSPTRYKPSDHYSIHRPYERDTTDYRAASLGSGRSRKRVSGPLPPSDPVIISNRTYSDSNDDEVLTSAYRVRRRRRSPIVPQSELITMDNRIYNDYEDVVVAGPPRERIRSRSRPVRFSPTPVDSVVTKNRVYYDHEDDKSLALSPGAHSWNHSRPSGPPPTPRLIDYTSTYALNDQDDEHSVLLHHRSPEADLDSLAEAYPFSLSRQSKMPNRSESISGSVSDASEKGEPQMEAPLQRPSNSGRSYSISRSQYTGDGLIGGRHAVELTVMPATDLTPRRDMNSIFRWM